MLEWRNVKSSQFDENLQILLGLLQKWFVGLKVKNFLITKDFLSNIQSNNFIVCQLKAKVSIFENF